MSEPQLTLASDKPRRAKQEVAKVSENGEGSTILAMIDRVMAMPDVPMEKITQLVELQQKAQTEAARKAFLRDFALAQAEMSPIAKDARNPETKSKYATRTALDAAMRPVYTKYGFAFSWNTGLGDGSPLSPDCVRVLGTLSHRDGHERPMQIDMPCDGKGPKGGAVMSRTHATGSALSYGERYLQAGAFNIVFAEDDDGNKAAAKPGSNEPINTKHLNNFMSLSNVAGADKERFCKRASIASYAEITVGNLEKAIGWLKAKDREKVEAWLKANPEAFR